jgi:hypothetical protein
MNQNAPQERVINQNEQIFLTQSWCAVSPVDVECNLFFTIRSSESHFFNPLIKEIN